MNEPLKPCPLCGYDEVYVWPITGAGPTVFVARCARCLCATGSQNSRENALRAWNDRVGPAPVATLRGKWKGLSGYVLDHADMDRLSRLPPGTRLYTSPPDLVTALRDLADEYRRQASEMDNKSVPWARETASWLRDMADRLAGRARDLEAA